MFEKVKDETLYDCKSLLLDLYISADKNFNKRLLDLLFTLSEFLKSADCVSKPAI